MLKNILNIEGTEELNKKTQTTIVGGRRMCGPHCPCPADEVCLNGSCWPNLM
jgi:hypothetical protein